MDNDFLKELKQQTDALHQKAHHLEFFKSIFKNNLPKESYIGQLRVLAIIYGALELQIEKSDLEFPVNYVKKLPLLLDDINCLQEDYQENIEAVKIALQVADDIMIASVNNSYSLIGYLYTLEGSLQGSNVIMPNIQSMYKLDKSGCSYFQAYGNNLKEYWEGFKSYLLCHQNHSASIIASSNSCFKNLIKIYTSFYDSNSKRDFHSAVLNPQAGNHSVPSDPWEIEAAISANKECWNYFPYLEYRYSQRGYRYGISDVAWLITLTSLPVEYGKTQIDWLVKVLSNLGIPSIILEKQLDILYKHLDNEKYVVLIELKNHLESKRKELISDEKFQSAVDLFDKNISTVMLNRFKNLGEIVVSAILDEINYCDKSFESLKHFFKNEEKFDKEQSQNLFKAIDILLTNMNT